MKYDLNKIQTKGAKRTLEAFRKEMFDTLCEKSFEEITVGKLCKQAQYPRATFYNYFEDKYDLLNYCWLFLCEQIQLGEYQHAKENEMLYLYFDRIYDFTKEQINYIQKIRFHNPVNAYLFASLRNFLNDQMRLIFKDCPDANQKTIPNELLADHYSNTLFLVWQYTLRNPDCTKGQAHEYLKLLISA